MPSMTKAGARLILEGYSAAICDIEKFHNASLKILEHFILNGENDETIRVFGDELVLFMKELRSEANERQLSGPIRNWDRVDPSPEHPDNSAVTNQADQLSAPINNWSHTQGRSTDERDSAWSTNGDN